MQTDVWIVTLHCPSDDLVAAAFDTEAAARSYAADLTEERAYELACDIARMNSIDVSQVICVSIAKPGVWSRDVVVSFA